MLGMIKPRLMLLIYGDGCVLGKTFSENVLGLKIRDETLIAWNILCLDVLCGTTNPVIALFRGISELYSVIFKVLRQRVLRVKCPLRMMNGPTSCHQGTLWVLRVLS